MIHRHHSLFNETQTSIKSLFKYFSDLEEVLTVRYEKKWKTTGDKIILSTLLYNKQVKRDEVKLLKHGFTSSSDAVVLEQNVQLSSS